MSASMRDAFRGAIERILNSWTALRLAVEHGFGGSESREKAEWMVQAVDQWFAENRDIDPWELEEFLAEVLNNEFDTVADDESLPQVSKMICGVYKLLQSGDVQGVKDRLDRLPQPALNKCVATHVNQEVENGVDDTGEEDPGASEAGTSTSTSTNQSQSHERPESMEQDPDGWVTVGKKGKRR